MELPGNKIEIMSPAGSFESLMAAIQGGAGSVYFGVGSLNMRSKSAANFTEEDLPEIAEICSRNGVKSYLTLNTIIYDEDLGNMRRLISAAKENGIEAVIASDISVMEYCLEKGMPVHISTQANITNIEAVKFYSRFAGVMVLARELKLSQVKEITSEIKKQGITGPGGNLVKIEVFIHGALCMAVSGKCYLSLHQNNYSANRGECLQICRRPYEVTDKKSGARLEIDNEYIMSPKDLCTIGFLDKIIDAGATVLKIEGRGRAPEYVKKTTKCYRQAAQAYFNGEYNKENIRKWESELASVFNRGFWDGYYLGRKLGEWNDRYGSNATKRKIYLGKGSNYYKKPRVAEFLMESHSLREGDEIMIIGPTTGVVESTAKGIRLDGRDTQSVGKGDLFSIPLNHVIRKSDKLYKVVHSGDLPDER